MSDRPQSGEFSDPWRRQLMEKVDAIIARLGTGDTAIAELRLRVRFLEQIVYGMVTVILLAFVVTLVALVFKSTPDNHPAVQAASRLSP